MDSHQCFIDISPDIILLVFEELYSDAPESFSSLRLTSHRMRDIATPFMYRKINLSNELMQRLSPGHEHAKCMIQNYTKHFVIRCALDWQMVCDLLLSCKKLESLTWIYRPQTSAICFPRELQDCLRILPDVALHVTNYLNPQTPPPLYEEDAMLLPEGNLVSLTATALMTGIPDGRPLIDRKPLNDLLVASRNLETLIITQTVAPFSAAKGRLPPIKKLELPIQFWSPPIPAEMNEIWDFSRLEELDIPWANLSDFLGFVPLKAFAALKCFRIDDRCWMHRRLRFEAPDELRDNELATQQIQALLESKSDFTELKLKCLLSMFDISCISRQTTLRKLELLDIQGSELFWMANMFPTISLYELRLIRSCCLRITSLALGFHVKGRRADSFLTTIAQFRNLHELTLYTESQLHDAKAESYIEDIDYSSAVKMKELLVNKKLGLKFSKISINVGGWKEKGRPFRGGIDWDVRRENGHNPERLFIFAVDNTGSLSFEEKLNKAQFPWPKWSKPFCSPRPPKQRHALEVERFRKAEERLGYV
ncbi:hypothetical protein B0J14DRAFT_573152 [Halenospora varia]|nr:hypothetical protein B0J14DRAFT_573152 [Halenospora varia]